MSPAQTPAFEALIVPYRSLTRRGIMTIVALSMVISSAVALHFWWLGAWPVTVFCLLASP
ncbi:MAG: Integral rane protein, partial [Acetobacteraceae bacterium]|nr:Integral rane protein [Acetobacteraceae bacterium]